MFLMWRLWRMLKGPLEKILAGKFSALAGQLRAVLSSTVNDLARAVQDGFAYSMVGAHITSASVTPPGKPSVTFKVFPLSAIEGASCIRQQLVKRLSVDVRLDALRTKAGVSDADWKQVLETYATEVQRFGVVNAIKQLVKQNKSLGSDYTLIDLAENEPLKIN
jgi:hypothetical protein